MSPESRDPTTEITELFTADDEILNAADVVSPSAGGLAARDSVGEASTAIPLSPVNGGQSIDVDSLMMADIILSTTNAPVPSGLIRRVTNQPVSHTILYVGNGHVIEAIGEGVVRRSLQEALAQASLGVAFRYPGLAPLQAQAVVDYAQSQVGRGYSYIGLVRQALFQLDKWTVCRNKEGLEYEKCVRWVGRINLGTSGNDRFICSELVLAAYEHAGVPLVSKMPHWGSPGDIADLYLSQRLGYVGHLKWEP